MSKLIYVADDEQNICEIIKSFLVMEGYEVQSFLDGESLLEKYILHKPDLVILDVCMPGRDGFEICTEIRRIGNTPIIIVSAKDTVLDRITGITLGSDDYMVKPFMPLELVTRVKALFRRSDMKEQGTNVSVMTYGNLMFDLRLREVKVNSEKFAVTPTEFDLLTHMVKNVYRAVSKAEILKEVWGFDFNTVDTRVIDDCIKRLRKKLKESDCNLVIETVWGYGFRLNMIQ